MIFTADHSFDLRMVGPGAEAIHGLRPNTRLFRVMMSAFGWESPSGAER